ncbi:hypothetical protein [Paenibacillus chibensis]|nr:hypothetical protein [Paenibacillus chibensis]MEC0369120.1 hypothetical protein [Paenibacillus chibensis]
MRFVFHWKRLDWDFPDTRMKETNQPYNLIVWNAYVGPGVKSYLYAGL